MKNMESSKSAEKLIDWQAAKTYSLGDRVVWTDGSLREVAERGETFFDDRPR